MRRFCMNFLLEENVRWQNCSRLPFALNSRVVVLFDLEALRRAYHSPQFFRYREEYEILASQAIRNAP